MTDVKFLRSAYLTESKLRRWQLGLGKDWKPKSWRKLTLTRSSPMRLWGDISGTPFLSTKQYKPREAKLRKRWCCAQGFQSPQTTYKEEDYRSRGSGFGGRGQEEEEEESSYSFSDLYSETGVSDAGGKAFNLRNISRPCTLSQHGGRLGEFWWVHPGMLFEARSGGSTRLSLGG